MFFLFHDSNIKDYMESGKACNIPRNEITLFQCEIKLEKAH